MSAAACTNCGAALSGRFCAACGQDGAGKLTFRELVGQAVAGLLNLDSRFWRTLRDICVPGRLSDEYLAGRRASYMPPMQTYLVVALLYFAVSLPGIAVRWPALIGGYGISDQERAENRAYEASLPADGTASTVAADFEGQQVVPDPDPAYTAKMIRHADANRRAFNRYQWLVLLALPLFALVLQAVHLSSGRLYLEHLVFAIHFQTFVFGVLAVLLGIELLLISRWWPALPDAVWGLAGGAMTLHGTAALHRVYRESWLVAALKFGAVAFGYGGILFGAATLSRTVWA